MVVGTWSFTLPVYNYSKPAINIYFLIWLRSCDADQICKLRMAGFECEFVEKPPQAIQSECPICLLVLREPYQATCCGNSFCRQCSDKAKARNQACPTCNGRNFNLFHNLGLQRSLYDFQIYCTHKRKGCEWTGELRELDNHLNSDPPADKSLEGCPFTLINCPLNCASCVKGLPRRNFKTHVSDNIDKLLNLVKFVAQQNTQLEARVANIEGDKQYLEQHMTELEAKVGELDVKKRGPDLKNKELEKEMNERLSSVEGDKQYLEQQLTELTTKVRELDMKNKELESETNVKQAVVISKPQSGQPTAVTGTYKPIGAEFTMTDFEEYKRDDDKWYSPHFYTHPNGYKMCLSVDANGYSEGKGTHLCVCVYLMRGEFDDQLKWPFCGSITVQLVDQEEDKGHVVKTIIFDEKSPTKSTNRVIETMRADEVQGYNKFLSHTDLQPKFIKDDCIKLRIKKVELY